MISLPFIKKWIVEAWKKGYDVGVLKGYELGYKMGIAECTKKGFIIGSKVNQEIEEILKRERF